MLALATLLLNFYERSTMNTTDSVQPFHFYAANYAEWRTSDNINDVIDWFKKQKATYTIFYVPLPNAANYEIKWYAPQVEGCQYLGTYKGTKLYDAEKEAA